MEKTQEQINEEKLKKIEESEQRAAIDEEKSLFYDFDAAIEEAKIENLEIKFRGKMLQVPPEMPFDFSMFFFRNCIRKVKGKEIIEIPDSCLFQFITLMFGDEFVNDLEKTKLGINFIFDTLAVRILKQWGYDIKTETKKETVQKKI